MAGDLSLCTQTSRKTKHVYPSGKIALAGLNAIADRVSSLLFPRLDDKIPDTPKLLTLTDTIKLSAWVHFMLLDLHAFQDGNGRVARIVGNYLLKGLSPFPVPLLQAENIDGLAAERHFYIKALEQARADSRGAPIALSMILIKNIFRVFISCTLPHDQELQNSKKLDNEFIETKRSIE